MSNRDKRQGISQEFSDMDQPDHPLILLSISNPDFKQRTLHFFVFLGCFESRRLSASLCLSRAVAILGGGAASDIIAVLGEFLIIRALRL
jgi:hypothetical protein